MHAYYSESVFSKFFNSGQFCSQKGWNESQWLNRLKSGDDFKTVAETILKSLGVNIVDAHLLADQVYFNTCTQLGFYRTPINDWFYCNDGVHPIQPVLNLSAKMIVNHVCHNYNQ